MIILKNQGEIDIRAIKTMGVNVKRCDSPIGYFGTGLKYAISVFLREGIDFQLFIGENRYEFHTESCDIGGKEFAMCHMRGPHDSIELPFTTDQGRNWELWQAYREIHSNCLDEGGEIFNAQSARGEAGYTTFCIEDIDTHGIFLHQMDLPKLFSDDDIEIYEGESDCIYYNGIRAKVLNRPSMYTYNILRTCTLTEDRLICYGWQVEHAINESLVKMADKGIIERFITAPAQYFESSMSMRHNNNAAPGDTFKEVYQAVSKDTGSSVRDYMSFHTPRQPKTRAEKRVEFMGLMEDACTEFGLSFAIENDKVVITGDLIEEEQQAIEHTEES